MSSDITEILDQVAFGEPDATERLLPIVYNELRSMAEKMMQRERDGHTLQTTALVHEAYLRLVQHDRPDGWDGRGHFFSAAAEAMRRILVEHARRKLGKQRGGNLNRVDAEVLKTVGEMDYAQSPEFVLEVDDAIAKLAEQDASAAELVKLKFFAGFSVVEAAEMLGISKTTAYGHWAYAKAKLATLLNDYSNSEIA